MPSLPALIPQTYVIFAPTFLRRPYALMLASYRTTSSLDTFLHSLQNWTLFLCAVYCTTAALFSYALWKHEREVPSRSLSSSGGWGEENRESAAPAPAARDEPVELQAGDDATHGAQSTTSSSTRSSTRFIGRSDGASAFDSEGELDRSPFRSEHRGQGHRMRSQSHGPSSRAIEPRGSDDEGEEMQTLNEPLEFPPSLQVHRPHRPGVEIVSPEGTHHSHRRKISLGELCLWLMYQTVWAAAIFCACTFWIFIGIGCLPRKGCTSVARNFWFANIINLAFIVMEIFFNKLPFIPFHSVLTLGYCVLWLVFSAILWSVTGNWIYPRSASHGQLYSAVTFWPGWIILNVGAFFVGLGVEWALTRWVIPNKHSVKDVNPRTQAQIRADLDIQSV